MPNLRSLPVLLFLAVAGLLITIAPPTAQGQTLASTASFSGTVSDSSGARIANATVTLGSLDNGVRRIFKTAAEGNFSFVLLPAGTYTLKIEAPGFKTLRQTGITLEVGQSASQSISLNVGAAEQIEVTADAPLLQTDTQYDELRYRLMPYIYSAPGALRTMVKL